MCQEIGSAVYFAYQPTLALLINNLIILKTAVGMSHDQVPVGVAERAVTVQPDLLTIMIGTVFDPKENLVSWAQVLAGGGEYQGLLPLMVPLARPNVLCTA